MGDFCMHAIISSYMSWFQQAAISGLYMKQERGGITVGDSFTFIWAEMDFKDTPRRPANTPHISYVFHPSYTRE